LTVVKKWAEANGVPLQVNEHRLESIRATPRPVAAFLEHIYGPAGAAPG
jgi:hypothetical protein